MTMASYVNCKEAQQVARNKPESQQLGDTCGSKEEEKEKCVYYNELWIKDLGLTVKTGDSPSPAQSIDSVNDLASTPDSSESDNGYEVPLSYTEHLNSRDNLTENTDEKWEKSECKKGKPRVSYEPMNLVSEVPLNKNGSGTSNPAVKQKPVPKKRQKKSGLPDSTHSPAESDSSLGSIVSASGQTHSTKKALSRQKIIYPVKGGSGHIIMSSREPRKGIQDCSAEKRGIESKTKDIAGVRKKAEEKTEKQTNRDPETRQVRSNSIVSEKFEDALEFLPDDWTPAAPKSDKVRTPECATGSGRNRQPGPVSDGNYEDAWDLNPRLEAKLSRLKLMHRHAETRPEVSNEGNYLEPWDTSKKQQELEEKIQQASKGRKGGKSHHSSLHRQSPGERHRDTRDIKKSHSERLPSRDVEGSGRSLSMSPLHHSLPHSIGGPVNSMDCLQNQEWYHPKISRADAEKMLRVCKDGSYLVRDSSDRCHYTLSIKSSSQIIHIQVEQSVRLDGSMRYILGHYSCAFRTIPSMIQYYSGHPVPIKGAEHMKLLYPVPHF